MNIPKRQMPFVALIIGLNVAIIPQLTNTASLVYGAVCFVGCCFLYARARRFRRDTIAQSS